MRTSERGSYFCFYQSFCCCLSRSSEALDTTNLAGGVLTDNGDGVDLQSPVVHESKKFDIDHELETDDATRRNVGWG